jgi:hypothetical protein
MKILLALLALATPSFAADLPIKAPALFVVGESGAGWYKGLGTFMEANKTETIIGTTNTFGGALNVVLGYQWKVSPTGNWIACEVTGAYHNVGGSNLVGSVSARWSSDQGCKFGGPIANVLQWLPAGASFPTIPGLGAAIGSAHPWVGIFNHVEDAHTTTIVPSSQHNVQDKFLIGAGLIQKFCTTPTSCLSTDTFFKYSPKQQGFSVLGTQQNIGNQYMAGVNLIW